MKDKGIIQAVKCPWSRNFLLLRLFRVDDAGQAALLATSSPVTKVAAAGLTRIFAHGAPLKLDTAALKTVLNTPGRTAWASFTALQPSRAALKACLQHDMRSAKAAVIVITLALSSHIVNDVSSVLDVVLPHLPPGCESAIITTYDDSLMSDVRVELLLMGV